MEDEFDEYCAAHQRADREADAQQSDRWNSGVLQCIFVEDESLVDADGVGRPHVVRAEHLEHARPDETC